MQKYLITDHLSFTYENSLESIISSVSIQLYPGWTGIVGANGSGKTTLVKLLTKTLKPTQGSVSFAGSAVYCEQRTDSLPAGARLFFNSIEKHTFRLRDILNIEDDWPQRWHTLSHGERKRLQIAIALSEQPAVLAVDEPSNHLDYAGKQVLFNALRSFDGIGLLISHDRELLDNLCSHTLFITPPEIDIRKCNYSTAYAEIEREHRYQYDEHEKAKREVRRLKKRVGQQRGKADKADKQRSKRGISHKDHDAKSKIDAARLTGKDAVEGRIHSRLKNKLAIARDQQQATRTQKSFQGGIQIESDRSGYAFPLFVPETTLLMDDKQLIVPELRIEQDARIGIQGDNGTGKSTFVRHLMGQALLPDEQVIYIPQEITAEQSRILLEETAELDNLDKGRMMTIIRRLGSDPNRLLDSQNPSPGEVRKLMLAAGIMKNPSLLIMDEPTNHMDLFSIQHIESALNDCQCAIILVSHDHVFLKKTVEYLWEFRLKSENCFSIFGKYL